MNWKNLSLVALLGLIACVFGLFFTQSLLAAGPVSIAIQAIAVCLWIWARFTFGARSFHAAANPTAGGLVTNGPYRYLRHPIYASILYFVWAGVAAHPSLSSAALGLLATLMTGLRIAGEEKLLVQRYPEYTDYARKTARVIPFAL